MFHRVIDPLDPDFARADPHYTVSTPLFDELLRFLAKHYAAVRLQHVLDAADGSRPLPGHALLITFDDGWADTIRYAVPLLRAHGMPAAVFAAVEAVRSSSSTWWQEEVFTLGRTGALSDWLNHAPNLTQIIEKSANRAGDALEVVTHLALMDTDVRANILASLPPGTNRSRMMMDADELRRLPGFDIAVGVHGYRHVPLTHVPDLTGELTNARDVLSDLTAGSAVTDALSCPHGRYNADVLAVARAMNFKLVFTSDKILNRTEHGILSRMRPLGRIPVTEAHIRADRHRLDTGAAARWLWSRERR
jgi:peptidoglycan/xylan/chitin deacetylase (PgdA/CDA1 family)